jgi:hypothetical protein
MKLKGKMKKIGSSLTSQDFDAPGYQMSVKPSAKHNIQQKQPKPKVKQHFLRIF